MKEFYWSSNGSNQFHQGNRSTKVTSGSLCNEGHSQSCLLFVMTKVQICYPITIFSLTQRWQNFVIKMVYYIIQTWVNHTFIVILWWKKISLDSCDNI